MESIAADRKSVGTTTTAASSMTELFDLIPPELEGMFMDATVYAQEHEFLVETRIPSDDSVATDTCVALYVVRAVFQQLLPLLKMLANSATALTQQKFVEKVMFAMNGIRPYVTKAGSVDFVTNDDMKDNAYAAIEKLKHDPLEHPAQPGLEVLSGILRPVYGAIISFFPRGIQLQFVSGVLLFSTCLQCHKTGMALRKALQDVVAVFDKELLSECEALVMSLNEAANRNGLRCGALWANTATAAIMLLHSCHSAAQELADQGEQFTPEVLTFNMADVLATFTNLKGGRRPAELLAIIPVGAAPTTIKERKASDAEGRMFLQDQVKRSDSAYAIPRVTDSERIWQAWARKVSSMSEQYEISDAAVIRQTTAHLHESNRIMFGWEERAAELMQRNGAITIKDFMTHVRSALFSSSTSRKEAMHQLLALHPMTRAFEDCHALVTAVRQIFARMYPTESTEEPEPMSLRSAVVFFHDFLCKVRDSPFLRRPTLFQQAWAAYTNVDLVKLYEHHLADSASSHPQQYLDEVWDALQRARQYHVQMNAISTAHATPVTSTSTGNVVAAAAKALRVDKHQLLALQKTTKSQYKSIAVHKHRYPDELVSVQGAVSNKRARSPERSYRTRSYAAAARPAKQHSRPPAPTTLMNAELKYPAEFRLDNLVNTVLGTKRYANLAALDADIKRRRQNGERLCLACDQVGHLAGQRNCPARQRAPAHVQDFCERCWTERGVIRQREFERRKESSQQRTRGQGGSVAVATCAGTSAGASDRMDLSH